MTKHFHKKHLGQHFLIDPLVIEQILNAIAPQKNDHIAEIGPGDGALSFQLANLCQQLDLIELDDDLISILEKHFHAKPHVHIAHAYVLQFDFNKLFKQQNLRIVGNLPYHISTPILFKLTEFANIISDLHLMLQKEVVDRMCAPPGNKTYGRLSIMTQFYYEPTPLFVIGPDSFDPPPKVNSKLVRLVPHVTPPFEVTNIKLFHQIVKSAFQQRRKTIKNAIKAFLSDIDLDNIVNSQNRPEQISIKEFVAITNYITEHRSKNSVT